MKLTFFALKFYFGSNSKDKKKRNEKKLSGNMQRRKKALKI